MFASVLCTESLQRTYIEQRILILALGTLGASGNDYRVNYVRSAIQEAATAGGDADAVIDNLAQIWNDLKSENS